VDGTRRVRLRLARLVEPAVPWGIGLICALTAMEPRGGGRQLAGVALAVVMGVALTWRSRRPEVATAVVLAVTVPYCLLVPELVIPFAGMAAVWSLTLARPPSVSLVGLTGLVAVAAINVATTHLDDAVFTICLSIGVWALAEAARHRVEDVRDAARQAAVAEKARIARELHDVIAHSVSVIVVQAAAAGDVFDTRPDQARNALAAIETSGRQALAELRRLLGAVALDADAGATAAPTAPQPGLDRLDQLVGQVRSAGLDVAVSVTVPGSGAGSGSAVELPAGVDLSAYRIVQEALTNTLRHAQARMAEVTVAFLPNAVDIEVVDDGRAPAPDSATTGFGIIGMRERAAVLGGTLDAAPTAHGGFRVFAHLPFDPGVDAPPWLVAVPEAEAAS
jgi:signal transduction histidine kinase